jgi:hypothetical protein
MYLLYWGTHAYYTRQSSLGLIDIRNGTIRARELEIWYPQIKSYSHCGTYSRREREIAPVTVLDNCIDRMVERYPVSRALQNCKTYPNEIL